jgi:Ran GTPase-activating protein (RanGAP) involved in mRNA processing and transport
MAASAPPAVVSQDILAITFSERHVSLLNIDGQLMDSATIAGVLREAKNRQSVTELVLRNVQIDESVADGLEDLVSCRRIWNKTEAIHCSGLLNRMVKALLPLTGQFSFTGCVPIAHNPRYGLDQESLEALGRALGRCSSTNEEESSFSPPLRTLSIKGSRLANPGFEAFCEGLAKSTALETLQLSCCALQSDDVELLASALQDNQSLKSLSLADNKFGSLQPYPVAADDDENDVGEGEDNASVESVPDVAVGETITQSTNNTNPQPHFSVMLRSLIHHPTLEMLNIFGMYCNDDSMQAIGEMIQSPHSKLWHLGLKNNLSHPEDKVNVSFLFQALQCNTRLTYVKVTGANLDDDDMETIGAILAETNSTLHALSLTDNAFGDAGLTAFAKRIPEMTGLRYLDVQRNPITKASKKVVISALKDNVELERLDLDGTWNAEKAWWLCLNRAGRRLLQRTDSVPTSLWPTILDRASRLQFGRNQPTANGDVMFYMLRRLPSLFEKASSSSDAESGVVASKGKRKFENMSKVATCDDSPLSNRIARLKTANGAS